MPSRWIAWLALTLGACAFPELNVEGRQCTALGLCPDGLSCVHGICVKRGGGSMQEVPKTMEPQRLDDGGTTIVTDDAGVLPTDGGLDAGSPLDAGTALPDAGTTRVQTFTLTANGDDASWCDPYLEGRTPIDEMASAAPYFDLSEDEASCRIGLRFVLPLGPGARIKSALLTLKRTDGEFATTERIAVGLFSSSNIGPFSDSHSHAPTAHAGNLVQGMVVGGWVIPPIGDSMQSPDLTPLVQAAVNRGDWQTGRTLGLMLGPETVGPYWLRFGDSGSANPPSLRLEWSE